jgi:hypothetical protein
MVRAHRDMRDGLNKGGWTKKGAVGTRKDGRWHRKNVGREESRTGRGYRDTYFTKMRSEMDWSRKRNLEDG